MKNVILVVLFLFSAVTNAAQLDFSHKDWKTSTIDDSFYHVYTNGTVVKGDRFGLIFNVGQCTSPKLLMTFSSHNDLTPLVKTDIPIKLTVDGKEFTIKSKMIDNYKPFEPLNIATIANYEFDYEFIESLMNGNKLEIEMVGNEEFFDIPGDYYSLAGFTANFLKTVEACGLSKEDFRLEMNLNELVNVYSNVSKEEFELISKSCDVKNRNFCIVTNWFQFETMRERCTTSKNNVDCVQNELDYRNKSISFMQRVMGTPFGNYAINVCDAMYRFESADESTKMIIDKFSKYDSQLFKTWDFEPMYKCMIDVYKKKATE